MDEWIKSKSTVHQFSVKRWRILFRNSIPLEQSDDLKGQSDLDTRLVLVGANNSKIHSVVSIWEPFTLGRGAVTDADASRAILYAGYKFKYRLQYHVQLVIMLLRLRLRHLIWGSIPHLNRYL